MTDDVVVKPSLYKSEQGVVLSQINKYYSVIIFR